MKPKLSKNENSFPRDSGRGSIRRLLKETRLKEIMTQNVITIRMDRPFSEVAEKLIEYSIRHLPVVDQRKKLVGLITQKDLYKLHSPRKLLDGSLYYDKEALNNFILKHVMRKKTFSMSPEDCVGDALVKMAALKVGCIPLVDENHHLCGIITQIDILRRAAKIYLGE